MVFLGKLTQEEAEEVNRRQEDNPKYEIGMNDAKLLKEGYEAGDFGSDDEDGDVEYYYTSDEEEEEPAVAVPPKKGNVDSQEEDVLFPGGPLRLVKKEEVVLPGGPVPRAVGPEMTCESSPEQIEATVVSRALRGVVQHEGKIILIDMVDLVTAPPRPPVLSASRKWFLRASTAPKMPASLRHKQTYSEYVQALRHFQNMWFAGYDHPSLLELEKLPFTSFSLRDLPMNPKYYHAPKHSFDVAKATAGVGSGDDSWGPVVHTEFSDSTFVYGGFKEVFDKVVDMLKDWVTIVRNKDDHTEEFWYNLGEADSSDWNPRQKAKTLSFLEYWRGDYVGNPPVDIPWVSAEPVMGTVSHIIVPENKFLDREALIRTYPSVIGYKVPFSSTFRTIEAVYINDQLLDKCRNEMVPRTWWTWNNIGLAFEACGLAIGSLVDKKYWNQIDELPFYKQERALVSRITASCFYQRTEKLDTTRPKGLRVGDATDEEVIWKAYLTRRDFDPEKNKWFEAKEEFEYSETHLKDLLCAAVTTNAAMMDLKELFGRYSRAGMASSHISTTGKNMVTQNTVTIAQLMVSQRMNESVAMNLNQGFHSGRGFTPPTHTEWVRSLWPM